MTFTSLISFQVAPGRCDEFEAAFEATGMLSRPHAVAGYLGAELMRALDDPERYIVIGRWATADAYREWQVRSTSEAPAIATLLATLLDARPGQLFHKVDATGSEPASPC